MDNLTLSSPPSSVPSLDSDTLVPSPSIRLAKHPLYYFNDGDLYLSIESTLFRVHLHFVRRHSQLLRRSIINGIGASPDNPVEITTVTADQFSDLLWVLYDETFERETTVNKWLSIIQSAEKLQMKRVIDLAIQRVERMALPGDLDHIAMIVVYDRHYIREHWADKAYLTLCTRKEPLSEGEATRLGFRLTVLIARAREEVASARRDEPREGAPTLDEVVSNIVATYGQKGVASPRPPTLLLDGTQPYDCYVDGGNITVEVGDLRFKVHRHFLSRHSSLLARMIPPSDPEDDKQWDVLDKDAGDTIIRLHNIKPDEFSWLLWLFYDEALELDALPEQWTAIRCIAEKYLMKHVGAFATKKLGDQLDLIERFLSIERFEMTGSWANETMDQLYTREEAITAEEGERLGSTRWARISSERERRLRRQISRGKKIQKGKPKVPSQ